MTKNLQLEAGLTLEETYEMMESQMSVSWEELDAFFDEMENSSNSNTRKNIREEWLEAKVDIFRKFGNKLRIEREVELGLSDREINSSINEFNSKLINSKEMTETTLGKIFILMSLISKDDVVSNRLSSDIKLLNLKFNKGMKVSRMLGSLTKNEKEKYIIQTEFSKITQTFKVNGTLVISIDPVDIYMMSFNPDADWRSCHNIENGEYRAGASTYVVEPATYVSYAYRRKAKTYGGIEVPNKTWRQLGYFDTDYKGIALSTHYPTRNSSNESTAIKALAEMFPEISSETIDAEELSFSNLGGYHYNDLVNGRSEDCTFVDLHGAAKQENISLHSFARTLSFNIGTDYVPSPFGGEITDSEEL